jgi:hypothetical protein
VALLCAEDAVRVPLGLAGCQNASQKDSSLERGPTVASTQVPKGPDRDSSLSSLSAVGGLKPCRWRFEARVTVRLHDNKCRCCSLSSRAGLSEQSATMLARIKTPYCTLAARRGRAVVSTTWKIRPSTVSVRMEDEYGLQYGIAR